MKGITDADLLGITGCAVVGRSGETIGKLTDVRLDEASGLAEWGVVKTGMLLGHFKLIPLVTAERKGDDVLIPFDKATVKHAPDVPDPAFISETEEMSLYSYYGVPFSEAPTDPSMHRAMTQPGAASGAGRANGLSLDACTKKDLYEQAKQLGIPGRSTMSKQALYEAVTATGR